jgi:hypothetical protein
LFHYYFLFYAIISKASLTSIPAAIPNAFALELPLYKYPHCTSLVS